MNVPHRGPIAEPADFDTAPPPGEAAGPNLRALLGIAWRGRVIILASVLVALGFALLAVSQLKPVYRATAKVLFHAQETNVADLGEVLTTDFGRDTLQNQIEILSSTNLVGRVVDKLGLMNSPEFNSELGPHEVSLGARLRALADWRTYVSPEVLADLGIVSAPPPATRDEAEIARRLRLAVIARVAAGMTLRPVPNSRVIELTFEGGNARGAAAIANALADQYIDDQLEAKLVATRRASLWLADRIEELRGRVQTAELAVETARAAVADKAGQTAEITAQQLAAINGALVTVQTQRTQTEARIASLQSALADGETDLGAISVLREAPVIASLRQQEAELRGQESMISTLARDNPSLIRVRAQLAVVRGDIRSEANRVLAALRTDLALARDQEAALEAQVRSLETIGQEQRRGAVELRQLEREAQASRTLYENFLARLQETSQQESLQVADARILSPAEVPADPVGTAKNRTLVMAVVLGLAAGTGLVFVLDRLNNTFRGAAQIEAATGLPVLASLPSVGAGAERADVVRQLYERPDGPFAEAVRNLRTSVLFSATGTPPRVVVFTSSAPQEGKSTSSLLLALTSQQMGRSAIIVDCDLRLYALSNLVGGTPRPGLLSVLEGRASVEEAIHVDGETGLRILATRPGERGAMSAADVVASARFADLIETLTGRYDLVVLDTPPVLVVTDARIIARLADAVVYAVRWDETPRGAVTEGLRELLSVNAPLAGIVLTMVDTARLGSYAYEDYGYYRSRYHEDAPAS